MAPPSARRVSGASARSHTRRKSKRSTFSLPHGTYTTILAILFSGILAWIYPAFIPPPPRICGSPNGSPVTASRIQLKDGRHLAYEEHGIRKENAKYKIIFIHGFGSCRRDAPLLSSEVSEKLQIYLLSFDRPGYGESDPDPRRSEKSIALDVEELADKMELGPTFYVVGFSMGGQAIWGCLKYIPQRLAGLILVAPAANYWWPGFPANLTKEAFSQKPAHDQWALRVIHYIPWLTYWWNTQKWFPTLGVMSSAPEIFSPADKELLPKFAAKATYKASITSQGEFESLHRDLIVGFGKWAFDPMELANPFPKKEGLVHLWQGDDDRLVPVILQRFIAKKLPWIHYHELPGSGHFFLLADGMFDKMVRALLVEQEGI